MSTIPRPPRPPGPYLVAGLGKAGSAAVAALTSIGTVTAWDGYPGAGVRRRAAEARALGARVELGGDGVELVDAAACVIKSPGLPPSAPLLVRARAAGLPVLDELELGWRLCPGYLVGVTGTNGKSTTAALIASALGVPGVAGNSEAGPALSALAGHTGQVVCEVSSFQLESSPELTADLAVLTGHSRDHLHRHGDMEAYAACKARLFVREGRHAPLAVVNADCALGRRLAGELRERGGRVLTVGRVEADYRIESATWDLRQARTTVATPHGTLEVESRLPGPGNASNVAVALAAADALGVARAGSLAAIAAFPGVSGRFELVDCGQPFDVVVDYAHTPDAIDHLTTTARAIVDRRPGAALRTVMSAAGTHDPEKRPEMGAIAARRSDQLVITTGSLFGEPPEPVVEQVALGARPNARGEVSVCIDRAEAFALALTAASPGDVVVIAGRGALPRLRDDPSGAGRLFDDRLVAAELVRARSLSPAS